MQTHANVQSSGDPQARAGSGLPPKFNGTPYPEDPYLSSSSPALGEALQALNDKLEELQTALAQLEDALVAGAPKRLTVVGGTAVNVRPGPASSLVTAGPRARRPTADELTEREIEVLSLLPTGKSNREIAASLGLSINTVESHVSAIFDKVGVRNRVQAAIYTLTGHTTFPAPTDASVSEGIP